MKKLLFIVNPNSGQGLIKKNLYNVLEVFRGAGYLPSVYLTGQSGEAFAVAKSVAGGTENPYECVVAGGGDGTMHEVAEGIAAGDPLGGFDKIRYGYIPAGTVNDFANTWSISKDPTAAAKQAVSGERRVADLGRICAADSPNRNHGSNLDRNLGHTLSHFVYVASFGLFSGTSAHTPQPLKAGFGKLAYLMQGAGEMLDIPRHKMKIALNENTEEEEIFEGEIAMCVISNSFSVGGVLEFEGDTKKLCDGQFELTLIKYTDNVPEMLNAIISLPMAQKFRIQQENALTVRRAAKTIKITGDRPEWIADGESLGEISDVIITPRDGFFKFYC